MKYPLLVKKHVSFICNFLLTKVQYFFNRQYPEKLSRNPPRDAAFLLKKRNLVTNDTVSLPVPYAACFSIYSHLSNMHNSCQKVFFFQCINAIFLENPVKMNMLRAHGNFPIRQHTTSVGPFAPLFSPPARWGLLDFMSVASSSCSSSCSSSSSPPPLLLLLVLLVVLVLLLNCDSRSTVFAVGPQPRPSTPSVPCRTSTTTIHAQCSLPDLNHDHPRPVFPAGPQPRPSAPSVPCRTSTTTIHAQCSLPDLNHDHPRPVFPAGPQPRVSMPSVPCRTSCRNVR